MSYVTNSLDAALDAARELHVDRITTEVRNLARQYPDATARCEYVGADSTPQCIIGRACNVLGITVSQLELWEGFPVLDLCFQGDDEWLQAVQSKQDAGAAWGLAVRDADDEFGY